MEKITALSSDLIINDALNPLLRILVIAIIIFIITLLLVILLVLPLGCQVGSGVADPSWELHKFTADGEECKTPVYKGSLEINNSLVVYDSVNTFQARNNGFVDN